MQHTRMLGAALDFTTLAVVRSRQADLPIMDTPYQLVKPSMARFAIDALQTRYATRRSMLHRATDVDLDIYHAATKELAPKEANYARCVSTLSAIDQAIKCRLRHDDDKCISCKTCKFSLVHIYWHCQHPALVQARQAHTDPKQQFLVDQASAMPNHILIGIPSALTLSPATPWWTDQHVTFSSDCSPDAQRFLVLTYLLMNLFPPGWLSIAP